MEIGNLVASNISEEILKLKKGEQTKLVKLRIQKLQQTFEVLGLDKINKLC